MSDACMRGSESRRPPRDKPSSNGRNVNRKARNATHNAWQYYPYRGKSTAPGALGVVGGRSEGRREGRGNVHTNPPDRRAAFCCRRRRSLTPTWYRLRRDGLAEARALVDTLDGGTGFAGDGGSGGDVHR
ncbi:hypothetical protein E2C01_025856 [Portunus trituberculatus]|uniref:Uncharacterized protein n=1 Tax=Portunus trituberculatus TaxID=210409 RepID=A0A5B7EHM0_PORTR|nr:hypothetical protein [Portunus trituberculatus]